MDLIADICNFMLHLGIPSVRSTPGRKAERRQWLQQVQSILRTTMGVALKNREAYVWRTFRKKKTVIVLNKAT
jgi:hypothetical protein